MLGRIPNSIFYILVPTNYALVKRVLLKFTLDKSELVKSVFTNSPPVRSAPGIFIPLKSFPEKE